MNLALDTNRLTDALNRNASVIQILATTEQVIVPFVVLGEIRAGFSQGNRAAENEARLLKFLAEPNIQRLMPDDQTTLRYAQLTAQLRRQGTPLPVNDVWIAALCVQHELVLFTRDSHFDHLPQLLRV